MQGEGKRLPSQPPPLHEQLSPPAGIHPLSTPPSSLTTPLPLKKKKLLKVILKAPPTPNPNRLSPSLSSPSSPPSSSPPPLSSPLLPHHHHHLQQHQLHHHQQLLLQQQHLHKQRLLQQQTQQLASELQLKLQQQHLLQQEHPKLLEQFKQQLQQEQICASSSFDSPSNFGSHWQQANSDLKEHRQNFQGQETFEDQEKGEERRNSQSRRRRDRSKEGYGDLPQEEHFVEQKTRLKPQEGENWGWSQPSHEQTHISFRENGQEQAIWGFQEDFDGEGEPDAKRTKLSEQHLQGNRNIRSSLRNPQKPAYLRQEEPVVGAGGVHQTPRPPVVFANGLRPAQPTSASSSAALRDAQDSKRPPLSTDPTAWNKAQPYSKPVAEDTGLKGGTAANSSSKPLGGSGIASVPGKKVLRGILDKLQKKDSYGAFSEPVDANEVPDYYDVIKEPMDFGTMRKRISSNFYSSLMLFEKDIFAICSNAMTFNAAGTVYHRQARAIKLTAERILDALKTSGTAGADAILKQKMGGSNLKKSHKKKQPWKSWTSDYVAEPSSNVGGRVASRAPAAACVADSYYVDWQGGAVQASSKVTMDDKEDATGYIAKSLGLVDGRRWQLNEESRRSTYRPYSTVESSSLANTVCGGPLQFVPAGFQLDYSYARSLARFAADLGPEIWKVAGEKIRRALPMGVPFGPGWVGQREAPASRSIVSMNKPQMHGSTGRTEHFPCEDGVNGVQRVGRDYTPGGAIGAMTTAASQLPMTSNLDCIGASAFIQGHPDGDNRSSEISSISQPAPQGDSTVRETDLSMNRVEDSDSQQNLPHYPLQAAGGGDDVMHNFEGDPILIPGRDLDGRHCLDYKNVLISSSNVPSEDGVQSKLVEEK